MRGMTGLTLCISGEFCLLRGKGLVFGKVFPVEQGDGEVDEDPHPVAGVPPDKVHAQGLVAS